MALVISPGMGYGDGLEDAADRSASLGPDQQVEVVGHEAVAEQGEGVAFLGAGEGFEEGDAIGIVGKNVSPVIAAVERVIDQSVVDGAR
jgi:hypothetical protein